METVEQQKKIVAVIPSFNESAKLVEVIHRTQPFVREIIIIDDGSDEPLKSQLPPISNLFVLQHKINLGKGAALTTGVEFAIQRKAEIAVFLDADGQHAPEEIPQLVAPILQGRTDFVLGVRRFHQKMPLIARLGNMFLSQALSILFGIRISDTQSGYRVFRLSLYQKLAWQSPRYAVETEMIVNAVKHGVRLAQVPIQTIYYDKYKGTTVIDGIRIFFNLLLWKLT